MSPATRLVPWLATSTIAAALVFSLDGCGEAQVDCPAVAIPSVEVRVTDTEGAELFATVIYTVDDGPNMTCQGGPGDYVCAYDIAGSFTVSVEAEGYEGATMDADVAQLDACSVGTETLEFTLAVAP